MTDEASVTGNTEALLATPNELHLLAAALDGETAALAQVSREIPPDEITQVYRLGPALYRFASNDDVQVQAPSAWRRAFQRSTARQMLFQQHLHQVGQCLGARDIPWLPIKGLDLCSRVYGTPGDRPAGDIDILVSRDDLPKTRSALEEQGWQAAFQGPRYERFLQDEGYCWLAAQTDGTQLEVHFRLWGMVPSGYETDLVHRSLEAPSLGSSALRAPLEDAYLLAAVHAWMSPPPRSLLPWWDLERIALRAPLQLSQELVTLAKRWSLELPLALAAAQASTLWSNGLHREVFHHLKGELRFLEKRILSRAEKTGSNGITLPAITLARLLAGRPSRSGWKAVGRRIWSHPGIVDRETSQDWIWPRRRLWHLGKQLGLAGSSRSQD